MPILGLFGLGGGISKFSRKSTLPIQYAIIAGGGGGAGELGGGGGAGGLRMGTYDVSKGTSYPVTVGGAGGSAYSNPDGNPAVALYYYGTPGQPSSFGPITATGGGGGGGYWSNTNQPGGSGGGGSGGAYGFGINPTTPAPLGGPFTRTEGYPGGGGNNYGAGGGGGAGSAGGDHLSGTGPTPPSGNGGNGAPVDWPEIPASYGVSGPAPGRWFAGGGGGGGGAPGYSRAFPGSPGIAGNTNGAGGQGGGTPSSTGSSGYAGIVMLRAPINFGYSGSGYTTNASPTHRVFIFTSPGSITFT